MLALRSTQPTSAAERRTLLAVGCGRDPAASPCTARCPSFDIQVSAFFSYHEHQDTKILASPFCRKGPGKGQEESSSLS